MIGVHVAIYQIQENVCFCDASGHVAGTVMPFGRNGTDLWPITA
jgi:hypothetical protein